MLYNEENINNVLMDQIKHKKGNKYVWIGFLTSAITRLLMIMVFKENYFVYDLLAVVSLVGGLLIFYGSYLELKAKNRTPWWLLLILPLNLIGVVIIFLLKDKELVTNNINVQAKI